MTTVLPTPEPDAARAAATSWRLLPLVMAVVALAQFNRISITVAGAEQIIRPGYVSETEMGAVYSAFLLVYTAFMIPGGWFIDRFGPRAAWMILLFGSAVFVTLTGVAGMVFAEAGSLLAALWAVRCLLGLVNAPLHPTGARLVANWIPPSGTALANGLITGAALVGISCTYIVFGGLMDLTGWRWAFVVMGGVTLLAAVAWAAVGADYPRAAGGGPPAGPAAGQAGEPRFSLPARFLAFLAQLLRNRSLVCLTLGYGALGYFQYLFFYWAQYYFEKELHLPKDDSRAYSSALALAMGAGMVLGGWLSDRARKWLGPRRGLTFVPVAGLTLAALLTPCGLLLREPAGVVAVFALAMVAAGMTEGPSWTAAVLIGGRSGGTAAGVMNTGGNAVGLLAPVLTPWIGEYFGWNAAVAVAAGVCLAGAALYLAVDPAQRLDEPAGAG
jgi:MFS family permease